MDQVDWKSDGLKWAVKRFSCKSCSSSLLVPVDLAADLIDIEFQCRNCSSKFGFESNAESLLDDAYWGEAFESCKDGGSPPIYQCPSCSLETFIAVDDKCVLCDYTRQYEECFICHNYLGPEEQDFGGLCSYHDNLVSKDD